MSLRISQKHHSTLAGGKGVNHAGIKLRSAALQNSAHGLIVRQRHALERYDGLPGAGQARDAQGLEARHHVHRGGVGRQALDDFDQVVFGIEVVGAAVG